MVIQQPEHLLSILVTFLEKRNIIMEEMLRQSASHCVFAERLNEWRVVLIEFVEVTGVCVFKKYFGLS
jgi:hypothetical protein